MGASWMVRRRRPGVAVLSALVVIGMALAIIAGRRGPSPVLATVANGPSAGLPVIGMDEEGRRPGAPRRRGVIPGHRRTCAGTDTSHTARASSGRVQSVVLD